MSFLSHILKLENNEIKMRQDSTEDYYQRHVQHCLKMWQEQLYNKDQLYLRSANYVKYKKII